MTDDCMPDLSEYLEAVEVPVEENKGVEEVDSEDERRELERVEEETEELKIEVKQVKDEEIFNVPEKKPAKKKRQMTEKQKENLAKARIKATEKRRAIAAAKKKQREIELAEKKAHIRERKARKLQQDAELAVYAENVVQKKEKDMWNEERMIDLMNRTMDTYFEKRKAEKEKRASFPVDPQVYANYKPGLPPARAVPKKPPVKRTTYRNPYAAQFGLTIEDEDIYGLQ
tara:strand:+ start:5494 stop:6180 length:687 start_codon:yes stop_codon:yes gene_type:complete